MSIEAMAWAKRQVTGASTTKLVLLVLADYANPGPPDGVRSREADGRHYLWAGLPAVADACEMSESTVKRHEAVLMEKGFIRKERRFSRGGSRLSDIIIVACDDRGPRPFPPPDEIESTKAQSDLRSPVTSGPKFTGDLLKETVVLNSNKTPPTPAEIHPPPPSPVPAQNRGGNDSKITDQDPDPVRVLIGELGRLAPRWRDLNRRVRAVLADPAVADRPPEVVRAALVELAEGKHGPTASPRRVLEDGPWWESASQRVVVAAPSPRLAAVRACDRCDPAGWALDDDGPARRCDHAVLVGAS